MPADDGNQLPSGGNRQRVRGGPGGGPPDLEDVPRAGGERGDESYHRVLDESIQSVLRQAVKILVSRPRLLSFATRTLLSQRRAAFRRRELGTQGLQVPAVMIVSVTRRCNLSCRGCYMKAQHREPGPEMAPAQLRSLVSQAGDLGISFSVLAGGEPLVRAGEILSLAREFPEMVFGVITNGLLIDETLAGELAAPGNIVPIVSFEGFEGETDRRRGAGVYRRLMETCSLLDRAGAFFGCSLTVTRENHSLVTNEEFIRGMLGAGCRVFAFVEYVPVQEGTEGLVLSGEQRNSLMGCLRTFPGKFPAIFLGFPGDEEAFGGCLSSGRGFVHVSATGDLEPCPAAPFSDANITRMPLREALRSRFLGEIRRHHNLLSETRGGCALWSNRGWVLSILADAGKGTPD
ncbi:MAG: radical SAM protein [Methanomicrobiales archaeon]|nr:radical SAM protein [Methanomicrobiales archaeon]